MIIREFPIYEKYKFIEKSFSNSRKIFRFLNWVDEIEQIYYYLGFKSQSNNYLKALLSFFALVYYLLDNLVFYSNIGLFSETFLGNISIKSLKQLFSLFRNITKSILDIKKYHNLTKLEKELKEEINKLSNSDINKLDDEKKKTFLLSAIQEIREKLNYVRLCLAHNSIRMVLILCSLKVDPVYYLIHPILSSLLAVLHSLIAFYKEIKEIKCQIESQDRTNKYIQHFDSVLNSKELNSSASQVNLKKLIGEYNKKYQLTDSFKRKSRFNIQENYLIPEKDNISSSSYDSNKNNDKKEDILNSNSLNNKRRLTTDTEYFHPDVLKYTTQEMVISEVNEDKVTKNKEFELDVINSNEINNNKNMRALKRSNVNLNLCRQDKQDSINLSKNASKNSKTNNAIIEEAFYNNYENNDLKRLDTIKGIFNSILIIKI